MYWCIVIMISILVNCCNSKVNRYRGGFFFLLERYGLEMGNKDSLKYIEMYWEIVFKIKIRLCI